MRFSIILPTYLGEYAGAAENREEKLKRAINSVIKQSFTGWELIVVCDGCEQSFKIASKFKDERISVHLIQKQPTFSGSVRNYGISRATGEFIIYIDSDDMWGSEHLRIVDAGIKSGEKEEYDWVFFNDITLIEKDWEMRVCSPTQIGMCGTSNIAHRRSLEIYWDRGYAHDFYLIKQLLKKKNYKHIGYAEYFVCHIPRHYDV